MPVLPPDKEMLARMPMSRSEYEKLRPRGRLTLLKQKLLNMVARITLHRELRIWLYRQMGVNIGKGCVVEMFCYLDDQFPELIFFDDHSGPSRHVIIICHDDVVAKTDSDSPEFGKRKGFVAPVRLKSHSGIGTASIILPGVTVHEGAAIGAGAVVTKDVPPFSLAVGIPAKVVKRYSNNHFETENINEEEVSEIFIDRSV